MPYNALSLTSKLFKHCDEGQYRCKEAWHNQHNPLSPPRSNKTERSIDPAHEMAICSETCVIACSFLLDSLPSLFPVSSIVGFTLLCLKQPRLWDPISFAVFAVFAVDKLAAVDPGTKDVKRDTRIRFHAVSHGISTTLGHDFIVSSAIESDFECCFMPPCLELSQPYSVKRALDILDTNLRSQTQHSFWSSNVLKIGSKMCLRSSRYFSSCVFRTSSGKQIQKGWQVPNISNLLPFLLSFQSHALSPLR